MPSSLRQPSFTFCHREYREYRGYLGGAALMRHKFIWRFCTGEFEIPVQVELFKPSQAWEGGAEGDGWVVLQLQVGNETKGKR